MCKYVQSCAKYENCENVNNCANCTNPTKCRDQGDLDYQTDQVYCLLTSVYIVWNYYWQVRRTWVGSRDATASGNSLSRLRKMGAPLQVLLHFFLSQVTILSLSYVPILSKKVKLLNSQFNFNCWMKWMFCKYSIVWYFWTLDLLTSCHI